MQKIWRPIDALLNAYTMYRVVLYGLSFLAGVAVLFGFIGLLPFSGLQFLLLLGTVLLASYLAHELSRRIFKAIINTESYLITALILFFILAPITNLQDILVSIAACCIAMFSKYLLAVNKKHLFNPAAIAVVILGLLGFGNAIWWVGSANLLPFVLVVGILVVRKIRRFYLLWPFLLTALITVSLFNLIRFDLPITQTVWQVLLSWPLFFFGTIMLTEPLTAPPRRREGILYSALVGIFFGSQFELGPVFSSPELSLIIGNIFTFFVSPTGKLYLPLLAQRHLNSSIHEFSFAKPDTFSFLPGQYLEWTLPSQGADSRGNRRYFTIASSPTESDLILTIKIPEKPSTFKQHLLSLEPGEHIVAHQLSGDFVLPEDSSVPLVFIAGGIGVTPFRSMIQYLLDQNEKREIVLFYACSTAEELVYTELFSQAATNGVTFVPLVTDADQAPRNWRGETGYLTAQLIQKHVESYSQRRYYISGPNVMVESYKKLLHELKIPTSQIVTDYFPGF